MKCNQFLKKTFLGSWLFTVTAESLDDWVLSVRPVFLLPLLQYAVCFIIESMHYTPALSKINLTIFWLLFILSIFQYKHRHRCSYCISALPQYINWKTLCIASDSERSRKCLKYFQHACYRTFPVYLGKHVFFFLLFYVCQLCQFVFARKAMLRKRTVLKRFNVKKCL